MTTTNFRVDPEPYTEPSRPPRANPAILIVVAVACLWLPVLIILIRLMS